MKLSRIESYSDAVFAIAATVLVLEIHVPILTQHTPGAFWHALIILWPQFLAYVTSFLVIGIYWLNHHSVFEYLTRVDRPIVWRNLILLLMISFIPFPTAIITEYGDMAAAVTFYGLTLLVIATYANYTWWYVIRYGYFDRSLISEQSIKQASLRYALGIGFYLIAVAISPFAPRVSIALYFLSAVFYLVAGEPERGRKTLVGAAALKKE
ncbi:MAG: DUF1211 domain-containing protein [Candidatus Eremiobacteraeota bacterium]|nr:DUF1211 domain-containing protein [Candidatus Eremiobacteraeota bacterium]MBV9737442.1 DUF1211 domain-containing protein [Candidatus Eremiobacteraeota bacterium]